MAVSEMTGKAKDVLQAANESQRAWRNVWKVREGISNSDAVNQEFVLAMHAWVKSQQALAGKFTALIEAVDGAATPTLAALCIAATEKKA